MKKVEVIQLYREHRTARQTHEGRVNGLRRRRSSSGGWMRLMKLYKRKQKFKEHQATYAAAMDGCDKSKAGLKRQKGIERHSGEHWC